MAPWYGTYLAELSLDPILGTKTQTFDFERRTLISKKGGFQLSNLLVHRPSAFPVPSPNLILCSVAISEGEKRRHGSVLTWTEEHWQESQGAWLQICSVLHTRNLSYLIFYVCRSAINSILVINALKKMNYLASLLEDS